MFRTLGTLAAFTLIGAALHKYSPEIFGELKGLKNDNARNDAQLPAPHTNYAPAPVGTQANAQTTKAPMPAKSNVM